MELKPAFDLLFQRPDKLMLVPGEMYPTARTLDESVEGTPMESTEHLGQYVFEMTQAKIKAMGAEGVVVDDVGLDGDATIEDETMVGMEEEEDPLHENSIL